MKNKTKLVFIVSTFLPLFNVAQASDGLWQEVQSKAPSNIASLFNNSRDFILNEQQMKQQLQQTQLAYKGGSPSLIALPLPNGKMVQVIPIESEVLPPLLAKKYPQIKTYSLLDKNNEILNGRLDFTATGFHAMLQTKEGETIYIDPISTQSHRYSVYKQKNQQTIAPHQCQLTDSQKKRNTDQTTYFNNNSDSDYQYRNEASQSLYNYRIAIATTAEYTRLQGGSVTEGLSAVVTTINRINQIYERDLGIHLTLVDHNDEIIFTNADSDPFSNGKSHQLILENQDTLDSIIGSNHYDIGHVLGTSGGGLAIINSLCSTSSKGKGTSGINKPNSENFYIDFVAHEIAHQFGATHTFNGTTGLCSGATRTAHTAFEPGSGSTIMAYTGICGSDNLQQQADAMFHIGSIKQIKENISQASCGTQTTNPNQPSHVDAGSDYTIPAGTPFTLQGIATDPENDTLSYAWQQIDAGSSTPVNHDIGNNALFRAYLPDNSAQRTFPPLNDILHHKTTKGETLPITQRTLNFKFIAQDGKKNTSSDQITLTIENTGTRFALDLPYSHYTIGESSEIHWNVAKTNQAPIDCTDIDIYLSTNGGKTFPNKLASHIANTGNASVYIPSQIEPNNQGRFKIACSDNIFFAISYHNFSLNYATSDHQATPSSEPNLSLSATVNNNNTPSVTSTYANEKMRGGSLNPMILLLIILFLVVKPLTIKASMVKQDV
jgi:hypothetical protein